MLIQNFDDLNRLLASIEAARQDGSGLVEFEDFWFTLEDALELAELCRRQLENKKSPPPQGRIIPIIDEDEEEDFDEEEDEETLDTDPYELAARTFSPPPGLASGIELFPHQKIGVGWLQSLFADATVRGGLLADDMGLGKTIQVLSFFHWHRNQQAAAGTDFPYLVVAPVALLANWEEECLRFFPTGLAPYVAHGSAARNIPQACFSRNQLILTNYETLSNQILSWATFDWAVVALDEAQQIKNPGTIKSQAARSLKSDFNIAMTGTPVENQLTDLWAIMDFADPGFLGTQAAFSKAYIRGNSGTSEAQIAASEKLRAHLGHRMLRRVKEDVLEDMPPKTLHPELWDGSSMHDWAAEMTPSQLKAHHDFRHQYELDLMNPEMNGMAAMLKAIAGFRAVADHPLVADKRLVPILETDSSELIAGSGKLQVTMRLLESIRSLDEKVIVFSGIRLSQQLLAKVIRDTFGINPPIVNGETPVSTSRGKASRQGIIDQFNSTPGFAVLVLSPLAAGVGLNITSANHVIHFTRHWNPAKESQATDRAYRIGQQREVRVYYPMSLTSAFVSFDAVLHRLLERKMSLATSTLTPTKDLKEDDFLGLLQQSEKP
jgi:SNF2 family DNA or RNA helicase